MELQHITNELITWLLNLIILGMELDLEQMSACGRVHVFLFSMSSLEVVSVWHKAQVVTKDVCFSGTVWPLASGSFFLFIIFWCVVHRVVLHFR